MISAADSSAPGHAPDDVLLSADEFVFWLGGAAGLNSRNVAYWALRQGAPRVVRRVFSKSAGREMNKWFYPARALLAWVRDFAAREPFQLFLGRFSRARQATDEDAPFVTHRKAAIAVQASPESVLALRRVDRRVSRPYRDPKTGKFPSARFSLPRVQEAAAFCRERAAEFLKKTANLPPPRKAQQEFHSRPVSAPVPKNVLSDWQRKQLPVRHAAERRVADVIRRAGLAGAVTDAENFYRVFLRLPPATVDDVLGCRVLSVHALLRRAREVILDAVTAELGSEHGQRRARLAEFERSTAAAGLNIRLVGVPFFENE